MSENKTVISQIFEKLEGLKSIFEQSKEQEAPKSFANATLADGTVVQWEGELAVGTSLFVVSESGEAIPAPDGQHTVEGGTVITTVDGVVTEIVEAEEMEVTPEEQTDIISEVMQILEPRLAALEAAVAGMGEFAKTEDVKKFASEVIAAVSTVGKEVEKFAKLPQPEQKVQDTFEGQGLTPRQMEILQNRKNK
jgi:hypothetical protein